MKLVEFTRDMRPQMAGSERVLPDDVAARLEAEGAVRNLRDWPERPAVSVPQVARPDGRRRGQTYQTK